uniref:Uncharacterized protein n=1 Tax=Cacopsylla melanoneura TaxID=428564 RepID=A0A8D8WX53_9HEMI
MLKPGPSSSVSIDLPPSGSKMPVAARTGTPPARKDLNRYLGTDSPTPVRKENLGLNLNLRRNRNKLKTTPDQSPSDENVTFLDSPTSSIDHMGQDLSSLAVERPRKKLSFREPEIMGYYMQMKQGVASRLSRKPKSPKSSVVGKSPSTPPPVASATVVKNAAFASETDEPSEVAFGLNNEFSDSAEDLDLEVMTLIVSEDFVEFRSTYISLVAMCSKYPYSNQSSFY